MCTCPLFHKTSTRQVQVQLLAQGFYANRRHPPFFKGKLFSCKQEPRIEPHSPLLAGQPTLAKVLQQSPRSRETTTVTVVPEQGRSRSLSSSEADVHPQSPAGNTLHLLQLYLKQGDQGTGICSCRDAIPNQQFPRITFNPLTKRTFCPQFQEHHYCVCWIYSFSNYTSLCKHPDITGGTNSWSILDIDTTGHTRCIFPKFVHIFMLSR